MSSATSLAAAAGRARPHARELSRKAARGSDSFSNCCSSPVSVQALCMGTRLICLIRGRVIGALHLEVWVMRVGGGSDMDYVDLVLVHTRII